VPRFNFPAQDFGEIFFLPPVGGVVSAVPLLVSPGLLLKDEATCVTEA
jgi:hypothetical protein